MQSVLVDARFGLVGFVVACLVACGGEAQPVDGRSSASRVVPEVTGARLDVAQRALDRAGLAHEEIGAGGGVLGLDRAARWVVCDQRPRAGRPVGEAARNTVYLKIARRGRCASPTH